jgi:hypothetical protein
MSEINANIVISPIDLGVTVNTNQLTFTPDAISLNLYTSGGGPAGALNANIANVHIYGGTNGYVLETDGTGNLSWTAQTGGGGNGTPGGSNTQVQYNDSGLFAGNTGFTYNQTTGVLSSQYYAGNANGLFNIIGSNVNGDVSGANLANTVISNAQPNITSVGTLTTLTVTGNISAGNVSATTFTGALSGAATTAGTVTTNAQPNITSVGTLSNLSVNGTTSIYEAIENVAIIGAQTGTYNYNILDGAIQYSTANATANITLNFRGNSSVTLNSFLSNGQSTIGTYLMKTGTTAYAVTAINIDGTGQSILWASNNIPTLYSNTTMSYTFTIIKTASSTYSVLGTGVRYG